MAKVKVFINGHKIFADSNQTILEVVHQHKLDHIPNLCLEPQLEPFNSCYLCLVEVKGRPKLVPACSTKVSDQMEIITRNNKIDEGRKASLQLLLSNHFADCLPPCSLRCPAGVDVQGYLALIEMGKPQEAIRLIKQANPFPAVCGRVCTRPCELSCRRNLLDEHVGIDFLKRYASDKDMESQLGPVMPDCLPLNGKRIAIIGGGPSGLSAAYYLRINGYAPTVFEAMPDAGGMLRYGIPSYRLPFDILDKEIDTILRMGVTLRTNVRLGEDFTIKSLTEEGFNSVFLAMGAWGSRKLGCAGQDADGVLSGIAFLEELGYGRQPKIHGRIVVVGGGNTAIDCARSSLRLGAKEVILLYRRTRAEMPANAMEIEAAEHEGVKMIFLSAPIEVMTENNRIKSLRCIRMELGEPDESGRRRPVEILNSDYFLECDFAFAAIGQMPKVELFSDKNTSLLPSSSKIGITRWGTIKVNPDTFETEADGIFAGGDMVSGAATAIEAIAAGRKAAYAIASYLEKGASAAEPWHFNSKKDDFKKVEVKDLRYQEKRDFNPMPELSVKERVRGFMEVESGYSDCSAQSESSRCLECGCEALFECKLREYASEYGIKVEGYKGSVNEYELDRSHPLLELDPNKCILCGRCIRVCDGIVGASVYGFNSRGFATIVRPEMGKPLIETDCISCGNCEATCPTGAIVLRYPSHKPGPWELRKTSGTCTFCSVGCSLKIGHQGNQVFKIFKGDPDSHNHGNLCALGRFGYGFVEDSNRLVVPQIKTNGKLQNSTVDETIRFVSEKIKKIRDSYLAEEVLVLISPRLTNEEIYLIQKFARVVLRTHQISSTTFLANPGIDYLNAQSSVKAQDVETSDAIVLSMCDLRTHHTVADFMVRKAVNNGTRLIQILSEDQMPMAGVSLVIKTPSENLAQVHLGILKALLNVLEPDNRIPDSVQPIQSKLRSISWKVLTGSTGVTQVDFEKAATLLANSKKPTFICEKVYPGKRDLRDIEFFKALVIAAGGGLIAFNEHSNTQGLLDLGGYPGYLPGYNSISNASVIQYFEKLWSTSLKDVAAATIDSVDALKGRKIKAVFVFGEDPIAQKNISKTLAAVFKKAEFVLMADILPTISMEYADCVIPMTAFSESSGEITNSFHGTGKLGCATESNNPFGQLMFFELLAASLGLLHKFDYCNTSEIAQEMDGILHAVLDQSRHGVKSLECDVQHLTRLISEKPDTVDVVSTWSSNSIKQWFKTYWKTMKLDHRKPFYFQD